MSHDDFAQLVGAASRNTVMLWEKEIKKPGQGTAPEQRFRQRLAEISGESEEWFDLASREEREADYVTRAELAELEVQMRAEIARQLDQRAGRRRAGEGS